MNKSQPQWTPEYVAKMFELNFAGDTVKAICDAHNATLAAERENSTEVVAKGLKKLADCSLQLLQGQAAIAELARTIEGEKISFNLHQQIRDCLNVDLSPLDKHDAEVRKPLVDAGNKMRRTMYSHDSEEAKAWDDALAKVNK